MWYITYLINHSNEIRRGYYEAITGYSYDPVENQEEGYICESRDDNLYSDLLKLETDIRILYNNNLVSELHYDILRYYLSNRPLKKPYKDKYIIDTYWYARKEISKNLPYFSDDNFLVRMREEYCLTKLQIERVRDYLKNTRKRDNL